MNGTLVTNRGHIYTFKGARFLDELLEPIRQGGGVPVATWSRQGEGVPVALEWRQTDSRSGEVWCNTVFLKDVERIAILEDES